MSNIAVVSGRSNRALADKIISYVDEKHHFPEGSSSKVDTICTDFANKEIFVKYKDSLRGKDTFIVQTFNSDPNKDLIEALILADTAFTCSARRITLVLPIIYGSRQDRKSSPRTPVTISTIAKLIKATAVDRVITVSLHAPQSSAAFYSANLRFDNLSTSKMFRPIMKEKMGDEDFVIVSPDAGGLGRARHYAEFLGRDIAFADKRRQVANHAEIMNFVGDVEGRNCFIVDDMIDTGGSLIKVIEALKDRGAKKIYCLATHFVLSKDAVTKLDEAPIDLIIGSDSIYQSNLPPKFEVYSLGRLLGEAIHSIHEDRSIADDMFS